MTLLTDAEAITVRLDEIAEHQFSPDWSNEDHLWFLRSWVNSIMEQNRVPAELNERFNRVVSAAMYYLENEPA